LEHSPAVLPAEDLQRGLSQEQVARSLKSAYYEEIIMAAGAAPAPETKAETKTEAAKTSQAKPATLGQRIARKLTEIFQGRDEYLGWRQ
jgi:hypothetical protein